MDTSESKSLPAPDADQPETDPRPTRPGAPFAALLPVSDLLLDPEPGEGPYVSREERLAKAFLPLADRLMTQYEQRFDRQAVLEALPDWAYDKLRVGRRVSEDEQSVLREYFALNHPALFERLDPVEVAADWLLARAMAHIHGHTEPSLPPRPGRQGPANDAQTAKPAADETEG